MHYAIINCLYFSEFYLELLLIDTLLLFIVMKNKNNLKLSNFYVLVWYFNQLIKKNLEFLISEDDCIILWNCVQWAKKKKKN